MKKYIDAEKLSKAIEEKGLDCSFALKVERLDTLALIDSLQQEQPEVDLDEETETWISTHIKVETGGIQLVNADELAKTVKEWGKCIARHFFELGLKAKEENK